MAVEIELQHPISLHNNDSGSMEEFSKINIEFRGKKGLKHLKGLQDCIYIIITELGKNSQAQDTVQESSSPQVMTSKILLASIEVSGKSEVVFDAICAKLPSIATINGKPLDAGIQDKLNIDDFEVLCDGVLTNFLLPNIIQKLNSMTS